MNDMKTVFHRSAEQQQWCVETEHDIVDIKCKPAFDIMRNRNRI